MMLTFYALVLEYNGQKYCGWQKQAKPHSNSIQEILESSLSKVANEKITTICAGRTDSGVHATAQVINFSTYSNRKLSSWILGTNRYLPNSIRVYDAYKVNNKFNSRFSALYRRYKYFIYNHNINSSLYYKYSTWIKHPIDIKIMNLACQYLIGKHNFNIFRSKKCQSLNPYKTIVHAVFKKKKHDYF